MQFFNPSPVQSTRSHKYEQPLLEIIDYPPDHSEAYKVHIVQVGTIHACYTTLNEWECGVLVVLVNAFSQFFILKSCTNSFTQNYTPICPLPFIVQRSQAD